MKRNHVLDLQAAVLLEVVDNLTWAVPVVPVATEVALVASVEACKAVCRAAAEVASSISPM